MEDFIVSIENLRGNKEMKTWEVIKELTENPSKKFMCKSGPRKGRTVGFDGRSIDWHDEYRTGEFEKSYLSSASLS